jgi:hypothetical protein
LPEDKENLMPQTQPKPIPIVLSVNICDTIIRDEQTKKVSLIGLFNIIGANSFPCTHKRIHVYIALTNGHGKYNTEIRFVNLEGDETIASMQGQLEFLNPLQVMEINLEWNDLKFSKAGVYIVEVLCDGNSVGTRKFSVVSPQQTLPPTSETGIG